MHIGKCLRHVAASPLIIMLSLALAIGLMPADALAQDAEGGVIL